MKVELNGRSRELEPSTTVGQLVDAQAGDRRGVAVAIDGEIVGRGAWDSTVLHDGARIELVGAVQGG